MESKSLCTDFETANGQLGDLPRKVSIEYFYVVLTLHIIIEDIS